MTQQYDGDGMAGAIAELVRDQPPAPTDRLEQVRRRAGRRRQRLVSGVVAVVVVAVAGSLLVTRGLPGAGDSHQAEPAFHRDVPAWALEWPDHRDAGVPETLRQFAVTRWLRQTQQQVGRPPKATPRVRDLTWYITGRVGDSRTLAVVFEATVLGRHLLVAGHADADASVSASSASEGYVNWTFQTAEAPSPSPDGTPPIVSFYDPVPRGSGGFDNWVVVLTGPQAQSWYIDTDGVQRIFDRGFGVVNAGQVRSSVEVSVGLPQGAYTSGAVGLPGQTSYPILEYPPLPELPAASREESAVSGQGNQDSDIGRGLLVQPGRRLIYAVRCYGPSALRVGVRSRLSPVTCDDRTQIVHDPHRVAPDASLRIRGSQLTAYTVIVGSRRR